jgi:DNA topoisomerase-1
MAAKNLVIVESPAKARTLGRYLGRNFVVKASVGHIADLPKSKLGVDVDDSFKPDYEIIHGKKEDHRRAEEGGQGQRVRLSRARPRPRRRSDRLPHQGARAQRLQGKVYRALFTEITKNAVQRAIENPSELDVHKFEAQQARRVIDRLVGYQISPLLWDKVRRGLSAGRVQSVAVRLIVEREREIREFKTVEYWNLTADLATEADQALRARLVQVDGRKIETRNLRPDGEEFFLRSEPQVRELIARLEGRTDWSVAGVKKTRKQRRSAPPFITSTLQQEASRKARLPAAAHDEHRAAPLRRRRSRRCRQHRLDHVHAHRLDADGAGSARRRCARTSAAVRRALPAERAQRVQDEERRAGRTRSDSPDVARLPALLGRALAQARRAQALHAHLEPLRREPDGAGRVRSDVGRHHERRVPVPRERPGDAVRRILRVYQEGTDAPTEEDDELAGLPPLEQGQALGLRKLDPTEHWTQPPARFTQASLIRALEEKGIGRPSTYATIMSTIIDREYVHQDEQKRLVPSQLGELVTDLLVESFPDILNAEFTADLENHLDRVESGDDDWVSITRGFYTPFKADLERAAVSMRDVKRAVQETEIPCENCGQKLVIKWGRNGEFLACPGYPECKFTTNFSRDDSGNIKIEAAETTDEKCEKCGGPMAYKFGKFGKFLGCTNYPECRNVRSINKPVPLGIACPPEPIGCGKGQLVQKVSRRGKIFYSCDRYPDCKFASWDRPVQQPCPQCEAPFVVEKTTKRAGTVRRCIREGCDYNEQVNEGLALEA